MAAVRGVHRCRYSKTFSLVNEAFKGIHRHSTPYAVNWLIFLNEACSPEMLDPYSLLRAKL